MEKGKNYGIMNAGYFALRTLRIEKLFAFWGQDLDKNTTPYECGRDFRVKLESKDFIGKMALMQLKKERVKRRFVQFLLEEHDLYQDPWPWGNFLLLLKLVLVKHIKLVNVGFAPVLRLLIYISN